MVSPQLFQGLSTGQLKVWGQVLKYQIYDLVPSIKKLAQSQTIVQGIAQRIESPLFNCIEIVSKDRFIFFFGNEEVE
jgi:hypothetical protein